MRFTPSDHVRKISYIYAFGRIYAQLAGGLTQAQQQIGTRLEDSVVQVGKSMDEFMFNSIRNIQTMAANPDMGSGNVDTANGDLARLTYSFPFLTKSCW